MCLPLDACYHEAMITSYHCHTTFSDGDSSMQEQLQAAITAGLDELGISDHYILMPGREIDWSMPVDRLPDYVQSLQDTRKAAGDQLAFRFGLEADYIPESVGHLAEVLKQYPFDYIIGSVHFIGSFPVDASAAHWDAMSQSDRNTTIKKYWGLVAEMARSRSFDICGHMDLYRRFGHYATVDLSKDIGAALDEIAKSKMAVELNTSGIYHTGEAYPKQDILQQCRDRDIPTLLTADAHSPANLTRFYDKGIAQLKAAGYTQQAVFENRRMKLIDF